MTEKYKEWSCDVLTPGSTIITTLSGTQSTIHSEEVTSVCCNEFTAFLVHDIIFLIVSLLFQRKVWQKSRKGHIWCTVYQ